MDWSYRIKAAREEQKLTREQLVERMKAFSSDGRSVSARTLIAWESGKTEPKVTQAIALARALGYQEVSSLFEPSAARQLNDIGLSRLEEYRQLLLASPRFCDSIYKNTRLLPVYLQAASAGLGQWLDDDASEQVEVGEDVPASAQFGVRLAGDSMEPRIKDGDLALVHKQNTLNDGDLGVIVYGDNEGTLKRFVKKGNMIILQPFNPEYEAKVITGEDLNDVYIAGKVVETKTKW